MPVQFPPPSTGGPVQAPRDEPEGERPITRLWTGQNNSELGTQSAEPHTDPVAVTPLEERPISGRGPTPSGQWTDSSSQMLDLSEEPSRPILLTARAPQGEPTGPMRLAQEPGAQRSSRSSRPHRKRRRTKGSRTRRSRVTDTQWWIMTAIILATVGAFVVLTLWKS